MNWTHDRASTRRAGAAWAFPFLLALLPATLNSQGKDFSADEWRSDLAFLSEEIREKHRNPFHSVDEETFAKAVSELDTAVPSLTEHEIIAGFARIVSLLEDGHTRLTLPVNHDHLGFYQGHSIDPPSDRVSMFHTLPLRFYLFSDGLHVVSATSENRHLLGARVLEIGGMTAEAALDAIRPYVTAENDSGFRLVAPTRLGIPEMLAAAGITAEPSVTRLLLEPPGGEPLEVTLASLRADASVDWVDARERTGAPRPLWLTDPDSFYWFEPLPEYKALYVQINQFDDDRSPEETAGQFAQRVFRNVEAHDVDRIIVDLRHNTGGDFSYARPFVLGLIRWNKIREPGHLFVITGRKTFSAAILLANELEHYTHVTFVGEPIGGTPNHYGDARRSLLPASGLTLRTSRVYWREWSGAETRPFFLNLPAPMSAQDHDLGRDPALEACLRFQPPTDLGEALIEADRNGEINSALFLAHRFRTDPATADISTEEGMNRFARALLEGERFRHAAGVFTIVREGYPASVPAHLGEAQARIALEDWPGARSALERVLAIEPDHPRVGELLEELEAVSATSE